MGSLATLAYWLVIIGALNWGLLGFFDYNIIEGIFGLGTATTVVYDIIGLSAVYTAFVAWGRK